MLDLRGTGKVDGVHRKEIQRKENQQFQILLPQEQNKEQLAL
jgi:hypothetical protein